MSTEKKRAAPKKKRRRATPAQQAARKKYLEMTGKPVDPKRIEAILALWQE